MDTIRTTDASNILAPSELLHVADSDSALANVHLLHEQQQQHCRLLRITKESIVNGAYGLWTATASAWDKRNVKLKQLLAFFLVSTVVWTDLFIVHTVFANFSVVVCFYSFVKFMYVFRLSLTFVFQL